MLEIYRTGLSIAMLMLMGWMVVKNYRINNGILNLNPAKLITRIAITILVFASASPLIKTVTPEEDLTLTLVSMLIMLQFCFRESLYYNPRIRRQDIIRKDEEKDNAKQRTIQNGEDQPRNL